MARLGVDSVFEFVRLRWIYPCLISFSGLTYFIMYGFNMLKERFLKEEAVSYGSPAPAEKSGPDMSEASPA